VVGEGERRRRYVLCLNPECTGRRIRHSRPIVIAT
jgi:hypothetical protein